MIRAHPYHPALYHACSFNGEMQTTKCQNIAPTMGLDLLGWAGSIVMEDFKGNGLLDLLVSSWNWNEPLRYFHNNGDGSFTERSKESGTSGEMGGLNMIVTDYNNDGKPDVVVLRGGWLGQNGPYPLSLLRNDGKGHFTDVTIQAGLLTFGPTQTAVAFDYNSDGNLDLFVGRRNRRVSDRQFGVRGQCKPRDDASTDKRLCRSTRLHDGQHHDSRGSRRVFMQVSRRRELGIDTQFGDSLEPHIEMSQSLT